jgi:hypothetical protein
MISTAGHILNSEILMLDGIYTMTFRGSADWGIGMLVLRGGKVTGADAGGALYDGRYVERPDGLLVEMTMTVPAGLSLVQGTPPQAKPYEVPFNALIPKRALENSEPVLVELPPGPVNVIVRRLRSLDD